MNPVVKICGEWKAVRDIARANGCTPVESNKLLMEIRNAIKKANSNVDVFITKPREIDITGARISSAVGERNLQFQDICEISSKAKPVNELVGSITVATPEGVCKQAFIASKAQLLEGYVKAAEALGKEDYSLAKNTPGYTQFVYYQK